ncbi:DNA polymerase III subunit gamma/tau, partial [Clostridioides difficile]
LSITQDDIKSSSNPRVLVEITIMKIAQPMFDESKEALIKRVENLEKMIELGNFKSEKIGNNKEKEYEVDREIDVKQENVVYEDVKNEDVILIESSWKNILKQIKKDKKMPIYALLSEVKSFNVYSNMLYVIFDDKFDFAKTRLSSQDTINYLEKTIRDVLNRSFNVKIVLTSEVKDINLEVKEKKDIGEEILKNIVSE